MRILGEDHDIGTPEDKIWRMFVLYNNPLAVRFQTQQVLVKALFEISTAKIIFHPLRFPISQQRRVKNKKAGMGKVVFLAEFQKRNGYRCVSYGAQSLSGTGPLFSSDLKILLALIKKNAGGTGVVPFGEDAFKV
jgi:hypothetical protein